MHVSDWSAHIVLGNLQRTVGAGSKIAAWYDPWLFTTPPSHTQTLVNCNADWSHLKECDFLRQGAWDGPACVAAFGPDLALKVMALPLSRTI